MATAQRKKASDVQSVCKKIVTALKKRYGGSVPKNSRPALETILYSVCLENNDPEQAEACYERLHQEFYGLNEIRVSSITELSAVFDGFPEAEHRALRIRNTLQHVFEQNFDFDLESLRRKTFDAAAKQLEGIDELSPFVRNYTLHSALGSHVLPIDEAMCGAAIWLGLIEPDATPESAAEALKSAVRKADAPLFCHLLRRLATDPKLRKTFRSAREKAPEEGYELATAVERLEGLFKKGASGGRKSQTKKSKSKKRPAAKSSRKKKKKTTTKKKKKSRTAAKSNTGRKKKTGRKKTTSRKKKRTTGKKRSAASSR